MKFKYMIYVLMVLACGCQQKADENKASGGVDGSGGNLSAWTYEAFDQWVREENPYFTRDMVHRLYVIQKNSPGDFAPEQELAKRFLEISEPQFMSALEKISYFTAQESCPSGSHEKRDGSYIADGRVCLSHSAFKNLPLANLVSKILILTMHELAHMRGLNEVEASKWQKIFETGDMGTKSILILNPNYKNFRLKLSQVVQNLKTALDYAQSESEDLRKGSVRFQIRAQQQAEDLLSYSSYLPSYILLRDPKYFASQLHVSK